jgi:hypothetical protein
MRYVLIKENVVINAIVWDGEAHLELDPGVSIIQSDELNIGEAAP